MYKRFLIFGGAGLCGVQVARQLANLEHQPTHIGIASLNRQEAEDACVRLEREFAGQKIEFIPEWGNVLVPEELAHATRPQLLADNKARHHLLESLYGDIDTAYTQNKMVQMILKHKPNVIVDAMNTATGFSYQDVFDGAQKVREWIKLDDNGNDVGDRIDPAGTVDVESFLLSQSVPQLIRHISLLDRATREAKTQMYVKIGTCGSGGMGLNIPFTHSEDRPSKKILAKTEAAFGHTGLLFLMARTPGSPIVKEVKPAAMIGYRRVAVRTATDRYNNSSVFQPHSLNLDGTPSLELREAADGYKVVNELRMAVVDTGENGIFTRGEMGAITALDSMMMVTPEEVATNVVREIVGATTGHDVISALDSSVLGPSYKAGILRRVAQHDLKAAEAALLESRNSGAGGVPSIALGRLGPPELSKYLFEASLFESVFGTLDAVVQCTDSDEAVSQKLQDHLPSVQVDTVAPSIGVPVLLPDGETLLRGPRINVPEILGHKTVAEVNKESIDAWAKKGWVDLRPANVKVWRARLAKMAQSRVDMRESGSAAATHQAYLSNSFDCGEMVGWICNNELGGHR